MVRLCSVNSEIRNISSKCFANERVNTHSLYKYFRFKMPRKRKEMEPDFIPPLTIRTKEYDPLLHNKLCPRTSAVFGWLIAVQPLKIPEHFTQLQ